MIRAVTFDQLQETLRDFGFEPQQRGSHVIFRHLKSGAVVTVPRTEQRIRPIYVKTAARQIENSGIATVSSFEEKLGKTVKSIN